MASKTRIIILHMKELLYTLVLIVISLILLFLFIYTLSSRKNPDSNDSSQPATYTSDISPGTEACFKPNI